MRSLVLVVGLLLVLATVAFSQGVRWTIVNWKVRHDFPKVQRISPQEVAEWIKDAKRDQPVLLDVRTKAEYDVSHIRGAQRVEPGSEANAIELAKGKPIVTYCSVGYRSGAFATKLQEAGYKNVRNMSGSIFEWANDGYPVERDGKRVEKVHPYNEEWSGLLKEPLRAQIPPAGKGM
ncbi:MAG: rhodanese-like domain-containing protein [Chthoniobacterales bacterium]